MYSETNVDLCCSERQVVRSCVGGEGGEGGTFGHYGHQHNDLRRSLALTNAGT